MTDPISHPGVPVDDMFDAIETENLSPADQLAIKKAKLEAEVAALAKRDAERAKQDPDWIRKRKCKNCGQASSLIANGKCMKCSTII